jgi:hypothetical protein
LFPRAEGVALAAPEAYAGVRRGTVALALLHRVVAPLDAVSCSRPDMPRRTIFTVQSHFGDKICADA